jgi:hypothetical protein
MTFNVHRRLMHHEGGTKFYQLFQIERRDSDMGRAVGVVRNITVTHWGKMSIIAGHGNDPRPVNGGETQQLDGAAVFRTKTNEKARKGYMVVHDGANQFADADAFERWIIEQFGAEKAHDILVDMSLRGSGARPAPSDPKPKAPREDSELAEITRPESWGSW